MEKATHSDGSEFLPAADPHAEPADIERLGPNQEKMLRCFVCLSQASDEPLVGVMKDISDCTGFTENQMRSARKRLTSNGLIELDSSDRSDAFHDTRNTTYAYKLSDAAQAYIPKLNKLPCRTNRRTTGLSDNPYAGATPFKKALFDCIRCLAAQDQEPTIKALSLCTGIDAPVINSTLRRLTNKSILVNRAPSITGKSYSVFEPAEHLAKYYLAPLKLAGCTFIEQRAEQKYSEVPQSFKTMLGCLACQQTSVDSQTRTAIVPAAIETCTGLHHSTVINRLGAMVSERLLVMDTLEKRTRLAARCFTPTVYGQALLDYAKKHTTIQCAGQPEGVKVYSTQQKMGQEVASCISCQNCQQADHGLPLEATIATTSTCRGMPTESVIKAVDRLIANGLVMQRNNGRLEYNTTRGSTSRRDGCNYKIHAPFLATNVLRHIKAVGDNFDPTGLKKGGLLSVEDEVRLATIIQTSEDPNKRNAAVIEMFTKNLRLATYLAVRYKHPTPTWQLESAEILQVAFLTLYKCIQNFDPSYGLKFSTYYGDSMRREIDREIARQLHVSLITPAVTRQVSKFRAMLAEHCGLEKIDREQLLAFIKSQPDADFGKYSAENAVDFYFRYDEATQRNRSLQESITRSGDNNDLVLEGVVSDTTAEESYEKIRITASLDDLSNEFDLDEIDKEILTAFTTGEFKPKAILENHDISRYNLGIKRAKLLSLLSHPSVGFLETINDAFDWQNKAACSGNSYFITAIRHKIHQANMGNFLAHCASCTVRDKCADLYSDLDVKPSRGIWGGELKEWKAS